MDCSTMVIGVGREFTIRARTRIVAGFQLGVDLLRGCVRYCSGGENAARLWILHKDDCSEVLVLPTSIGSADGNLPVKRGLASWVSRTDTRECVNDAVMGERTTGILSAFDA